MNDSTHPPVLAQDMTYTPCGALSSLTNGCAGSGCTNIQETYFYNTRMQMAVAELGTATTHSADSCRVYNYYVGVANASACSESPSNWPQGSNNNGDLGGYYYHDNVNSGLDHAATYGYDGVDRLHTAAATGSIAYSQTFAYDAYGNMTCTASPAEVDCLAPTYSATTNRITTSGYTYDASGDVTGDGTNTYQWDAEARLTKAVNGAGTAISTNTYNALGQRVRDVNSINTTDEGYGAGGALLRRFTNNSTDPNERSFVPFQGRILAEYYGGSPIGTIFDHPDEIGTLATASLYDGNTLQERLYYPFGEFWTGAGSLGVHQTFAHLPDYDPETDQYNTLARHYTPSGRWMSPDPGPWIFLNPQSYNAYAYVVNDPLRFWDDGGQTYQDRVNAAYGFAAQNIPYVSGGKEPGCGLDCSGLVQNVFKADPDNPISGLATGLPAAGYASILQKQGDYSTDINNAQPGDAIFFTNSNGDIVHTGIVVDIRDGRVYFVHAPHSGPGMKVSVNSVSMINLHFGSENFAGVGRPFEPTIHPSPNVNQNQNTNSGGLWNWFENAFFNWTPPPPPPLSTPEVNSFLCGGSGEPVCDK